MPANRMVYARHTIAPSTVVVGSTLVLETQRHGDHRGLRQVQAPKLCVLRASVFTLLLLPIPIDDSTNTVHQLFFMKIDQQPESQNQQTQM